MVLDIKLLKKSVYNLSITIKPLVGELIGLINQLANCESKQNKFNSMTNYSKNFVIGVDNKKV